MQIRSERKLESMRLVQKGNRLSIIATDKERMESYSIYGWRAQELIR